MNFSNTTKFSLIYQASRDGFKINDVHSKCDGILNTLMIVQTNKTSHLFGFFTTKNWGETSQLWQYDKNAFLFSLVNQFNTSYKMNVINPELALRVYPNELDIGLEILINDEFNTNLNYGWSGVGNSFELPNFLNDTGYMLINTYSSGFYAYEIEVYEVDGKLNNKNQIEYNFAQSLPDIQLTGIVNRRVICELSNYYLLKFSSK